LEPAAALGYARRKMKKILRSSFVAWFGAALGTIGLIACDAIAPPNTGDSGTVTPEAIPEGETLSDVVRAALIDVLRDPDAFSRARRFGALLPTLGPEHVSTTMETLLLDSSLDFGATELELLTRYWATYEPEKALHWSVKKSPIDYRPAAVFSAISVWAEMDPQAASAAVWPLVVVPAFERVAASALVRGWYAANDPPELRQWIGDLPIGIPRQRAIAAYIRVLVQTQGSEAAKRWAESIPDEDEAYKLAVFRRLTSALSVLDLEAGIRWCEAHADGPYGNNLRGIIASRWVLKDGPSALAWLSSAPEGYERDLTVRLTFTDWARRERKAALDWMATQTTAEPDPWLRAIYPEYAKFLAADAPAEAIGWAERIEGDVEREAILITVSRSWRNLDEAAAEDWLLQSPLSEEAREKVRDPTEGEPPRPNG
jgi:hypothetical protein